MPRMISLSEWAQNEFGDLRPGSQTLARYARARMIVPPAVKVGRHWLVDKEARFVGELARPILPPNAHPKLKGIIEDGSQAQNS